MSSFDIPKVVKTNIFVNKKTAIRLLQIAVFLAV